MTRRPRLLLLTLALFIAAGVGLAQRFRSRYSNREYSNPRAHAEGEVPAPWKVDSELPKDIFTFVRIRYTSSSGWSRGGGWRTDYSDADLNLAYRLQELTALKVHPDGKVIELTDPELYNYPFIYIVEPGALVFSETEVQELRRYLLKGGFLMVDDFWGERQWENFYYEIKRVFPEREPTELPMEHPIFHSVFDLKFTKNQLQVPNIRTGVQSQYTGITWEVHDGEECKEVHFKGIFDDKGRMMVMICHNTDNGDGWEREGEDSYFFREFSEKKAYPLAINIIFYAMTH